MSTRARLDDRAGAGEECVGSDQRPSGDQRRAGRVDGPIGAHEPQGLPDAIDRTDGGLDLPSPASAFGCPGPAGLRR